MSLLRRAAALALLALSASLADGCAAHARGAEPAARESVEGADSTGFTFARKLDLLGHEAQVTTTQYFSAATGNFDPNYYAAATFYGTEGMDLAFGAGTWADVIDIWDATPQLFRWNGPAYCAPIALTDEGPCNANDTTKWTLVSRGATTGEHSTALQHFTLDQDNRYMVMALSTPSAYSWGASYSLYAVEWGDEASVPAARASGLVTCDEKALIPATGAHVSIDGEEAIADENGRFALLKEHTANQYEAGVQRDADSTFQNFSALLVPGDNDLRFTIDCGSAN